MRISGLVGEGLTRDGYKKDNRVCMVPIAGEG